MSIVVAVRKDKQFCLASDTQGNRGSLTISAKRFIDDDKIINVGESFMGMTGWAAIAQIFEHIQESQPTLIDFSSSKKIYESLLQIHPIMKENYFLETDEDDDEQPVESNHLSALIMNKDGLFEVDSFREVNEIRDFWAIGSGNSIALGALNALYDKNFTAEEIAEEAVKAACEFDDGCGLPMLKRVINL